MIRTSSQSSRQRLCVRALVCAPLFVPHGHCTVLGKALPCPPDSYIGILLYCIMENIICTYVSSRVVVVVRPLPVQPFPPPPPMPARGRGQVPSPPLPRD